MRNIGKLTAIAATAVVAGGSALLLKEKLAKSSGTGAGCSPNNPVPHAGSGAEMGRIARVAERLRRVWPDVTGESGPMPEAALEIALSQAFLESGVAEAGGGGWWKDKSSDGTGGNMVGSGNLGARQCGANDAGGDYYTCVEYGDSAPNADGTQTYFPAKFRYYKAGTIGGKSRDAGDVAAYDFLYSIVRQWPALAELKSGDVLAYAIRQGPKYRKADPPSQKVFGREYAGGNGYYGGFGATMQDRVGSYGRAIVSHLPAVAAALGHKKIYACIAPELLAGGATHAAVSGGCCGGPDPEDILLVHSLNDDPFASDAAAEMAEKNIEGTGVAIATAVATAVLATGAGTLLSHHLDKGKPKVIIRLPKELVQAAQKKKQGSKKKMPESSSSPPPLDEDRGSIAALTASPATVYRGPGLLPGTRKDPASGDVYYTAPLQVATEPPRVAPAPLQVATSVPELSDDRGSIAALKKIPGVTVTVPGQLVPVAPPSSQLTREDIKQMFPTYTESQVDDALKGLQGADASVEGVVSPTVAAVTAFVSGAVTGASGLLLAQAATSRRDNAPTITPEPPPPIAPPPAKQPQTYVVKAGDSPFKIAAASDAAKRPHWWNELAKANPHKETSGVPRGWKQLLPGETIVIPSEWSAARSVEGAVQVEGIGTVAAIVAALVAGGAYAANAAAEKDASVLVQALRSHGIKVVSPGTEPSAGYIQVSESNPAVQEALSQLSTDSQANALLVLRSLLVSGFGLQAYSATLASGEQAAEILSSPPVAAASAAIARAASIQGAESAASFRLDGDAKTIDAIVPAYNEETTVAGVAKALMMSGQFGRVIVVDDGSTDGTAKEAAAAGAEVISLPSNGGKTAAMFAGVAASTAPDIAFFDADATVILPEHAKTLVDAYRSGDYAQVCGTLDGEYSNGAVLNTSRLGTGERIVSRRVLDSVPVTCGGYTAETAINYAADKLGKTHTVRLSGLTLRHKTDKKGVFAGTVDNARMIGEMAAARFALAVSGGKSCNLAGATNEGDNVNAYCGQSRCPVDEPHSHATYGNHLSGEKDVTPESAAASDAYATRAHVEGAGKIAAAVAVTAATAAGTAYLVHRRSADMTARVGMLKTSLRNHGLDLIKETDPVPPGYVLAFGSLAMDPGLYAAIEEYEKASGARDGMRILEQLATGTRLIRKDDAATVEGVGTVGTVAAVVAGGLTAGALAALALSAASKDAPSSAPVAPSAAAPTVSWSPPPAKPRQAAKEDAQKTLKQLQSELAAMVTPEPGTTTIKASQAAIAAKAAQVNAAKAALDSATAPPVAPAPKPEDVVASAKTSAQLNLISAERKLGKAKSELTAMITPDSTGTLPADQDAIAKKSEEVKALQKQVDDIRFLLSGSESESAWALSVSGMVDAFDSDTGHGTILPLDGSEVVHFNAPTASVGEFVQFEPVQEDGKSSAVRGTGDSLLALHLSGTLPMARAIPGSGGSRVVWYVEKSRAADSAPIGGTVAAPVRFTRIVRPLRLMGVGDSNPFCGGDCAVNEPHSHAAPVGAAQDDEPDASDKAMASASDATDAVSSLINAVAKGKRAIQRQAAIEDPKCRKAVRMFVEKHPLVARWFAPELRDMAGVDIGCACNSVGATAIESFANRYTDELIRQRVAHGYDGAECEPSPEEDRAVLGALMAPLGLTKEEEDNVYTAASRTAATALDMYLPGAGARASEASDAISQLITGRKMAPHSEAPQAHAPKAPGADQTKKLKTQLATANARVAVAKQFVAEHPHIVAWFNPDLRKL